MLLFHCCQDDYRSSQFCEYDGQIKCVCQVDTGVSHYWGELPDGIGLLPLKNKKHLGSYLPNVYTGISLTHCRLNELPQTILEESKFDFRLIVLGFNDTSTLEGHFVSSPREREKRDRRESRGDEREGQGRKRNRNESEETEEIKTFPLYPYPLQG